jgi:hypothetical protein
MATRDIVQRRLWLAAFAIVQLVGLWQAYGAWLWERVMRNGQ